METLALALLKDTVDWLANKGRDGRKLEDSIESLDRSLASKKGQSSLDLQDSIAKLKEGSQLLQSKNKDQDTESTAALTESLHGLKLTELDISDQQAQKKFKEAQRKATDAFYDDTKSTLYRVTAMVILVVATMLENVDYPTEALLECMLYLEKLHSMPDVRKSFQMILNRVRSLRTDYVRIFTSICFVNQAIYEFSKTAGRPEGQPWPCVNDGKNEINIVTDKRVPTVLEYLKKGKSKRQQSQTSEQPRSEVSERRIRRWMRRRRRSRDDNDDDEKLGTLERPHSMTIEGESRSNSDRGGSPRSTRSYRIQTSNSDRFASPRREERRRISRRSRDDDDHDNDDESISSYSEEMPLSSVRSKLSDKMHYEKIANDDAHRSMSKNNKGDDEKLGISPPLPVLAKTFSEIDYDEGILIRPHSQRSKDESRSNFVRVGWPRSTSSMPPPIRSPFSNTEAHNIYGIQTSNSGRFAPPRREERRRISRRSKDDDDLNDNDDDDDDEEEEEDHVVVYDDDDDDDDDESIPPYSEEMPLSSVRSKLSDKATLVKQPTQMQYEKIENDDGHQPIRIAFEDDDLKLGPSRYFGQQPDSAGSLQDLTSEDIEIFPPKLSYTAGEVRPRHRYQGSEIHDVTSEYMATIPRLAPEIRPTERTRNKSNRSQVAGEPPMTVLDKNGIRIMFHFTKTTTELPRNDLLFVMISIMSFLPSAVNNFTFQARVPRSMQIKLQRPSGNKLPPHIPGSPPPTIQQGMVIANPRKEKITLRYFVKYQVVDGEEITELGEVGFPTALE